MKPLNLIVGLNLGLLLTGCPSDDGGDEGAGSGTAETSDGTTTTTTTNPTTTEGDETTGSTGSTTTEPSTTSDETGTTAAETGTTTTEPGTTTGDETTGEPALGFAEAVYPIIMANCSCHVNGASGGLPMPDAATAYGNLVDVPSANPANGQDRIEPGDPDASFLWHKINGTLAAGEGQPMPLGAASLSAGDLGTIEEWILGGAQP